MKNQATKFARFLGNERIGFASLPLAFPKDVKSHAFCRRMFSAWCPMRPGARKSLAFQKKWM